MKLVTVLLEMSPVTCMFTFLQPRRRDLADTLAHPLDSLNAVYPTENVAEAASNRMSLKA